MGRRSPRWRTDFGVREGRRRRSPEVRRREIGSDDVREWRKASTGHSSRLHKVEKSGERPTRKERGSDRNGPDGGEQVQGALRAVASEQEGRGRRDRNPPTAESRGARVHGDRKDLEGTQAWPTTSTSETKCLARVPSTWPSCTTTTKRSSCCFPRMRT
ncbi:hypothetical protein L596_004293 [Steinernema carpocapsae]|uniref:Uncharacterized protein n=1 Tax=Steinernema carpocapsae TaxID=34508 RepID=A0A4U8UVA2_STECR|nr:hypothetical protein L596_004293 [Steinernema carpocapsae]